MNGSAEKSVFLGAQIAKFRLILKKVGKTTSPVRYDLNQIPYDYTLEVMNRFKELDLADRVPEELWRKVCKKKNCKKAKWLSEEALQIAEKEEKQKVREKGKDIPN